MTTSTLIPTDASKLQAGDRILLNSKSWIVKYISEPDRIGTYDLTLIDDSGTPGVGIVNGIVTIIA
jgi:hypothetical protein